MKLNHMLLKPDGWPGKIFNKSKPSRVGYTYPDVNDELTLQFLKEKEAEDNYWEVSEKAVIRLILDKFNQSHPSGTFGFLDAGCGKGRLIPAFASYFSHVTAIEPDPARYKQTVDLIQSAGLNDKVTVKQQNVLDLVTEPSYDLVLTSHVIQHIPSLQVHPFLETLSKVLKKDGLLAITTCHSKRRENYFIKSFLENGKTAEREISEKEFNMLPGKTGILPVQFFNQDILVDYLASLGLTLVDFRVFHIEKKEREATANPFPDDIINSSKDLQARSGLDMLVLVRK